MIHVTLIYQGANGFTPTDLYDALDTQWPVIESPKGSIARGHYHFVVRATSGGSKSKQSLDATQTRAALASALNPVQSAIGQPFHFTLEFADSIAFLPADLTTALNGKWPTVTTRKAPPARDTFIFDIAN